MCKFTLVVALVGCGALALHEAPGHEIAPTRGVPPAGTGPGDGSGFMQLDLPAHQRCPVCCELYCVPDYAEPYCFCTDCVPMGVSACPPGLVDIEDCPPNGGGGAGWSTHRFFYFVSTDEESGEPVVHVFSAESGTMERLSLDPDATRTYVEELQEFSTRFPPDMPLDMEAAEALMDQLFLDFGEDELNEHWQLHMLHRVALAGAHPEISEEAWSALYEGLTDYLDAGWGDDYPTVKANLARTRNALSPPGPERGVEDGAPDSHMPNSPTPRIRDETPILCRVVCDCIIQPPLPPVCWCAVVCE